MLRSIAASAGWRRWMLIYIHVSHSHGRCCKHPFSKLTILPASCLAGTEAEWQHRRELAVPPMPRHTSWRSARCVCSRTCSLSADSDRLLHATLRRHECCSRHPSEVACSLHLNITSYVAHSLHLAGLLPISPDTWQGAHQRRVGCCRVGSSSVTAIRRSQQHDRLPLPA
jgi:hypothetical protein